MKHHVGEIIQVYDGDFIGWTTATLIEYVGECGEYERWRMVTKEGSELVRLVDFDKEYIKKTSKFYQPVLFKRSKNAEWEEGTLVVNSDGESILDSNKVSVKNVYKYKSNWF